MRLLPLLFAASVPFAPIARCQDDAYATAEHNAAQTKRAVGFALRYASGWLAHADPRSGLLPRNLTTDAFWNAKDCAADNYPFLALTGLMTGLPHLRRTCDFILEQEQKLCSRVDGMPDDFVFATQRFRTAQPNLEAVIFGAAEYCKDGLLPMTEWAGQGSWSVRMLQLLRAIALHSDIDSPAGKLPSLVLEVNGDLLQAYSRAYWLSGDPLFAEHALRLGDYYLLHAPLLAADKLPLRDHGCEVIGGLGEAYVIAAAIDPARREGWRAPLHALLDCVLQHGVRSDGLMHNAIDPKTGAPVGTGASDGWGYVLDGVLTVAEVDHDDAYRAAARTCLQRVTSVECQKTPGLGGADGCADTLEGALNLLQRLPEPATFAWVDRQIEQLFTMQRPDGILEAWYGDGNSARTMWMWALQKSQGIVAQPWREDVALGAERLADGSLRVSLSADFAWQGTLRFERPRADLFLHLPFDYARINQWPEWYPVARHEVYALRSDTGGERMLAGRELWSLPLSLQPKQTIHFTLVPQPDRKPPLRTLAYGSQKGTGPAEWQRQVRGRLLALLQLDDLLQSPPGLLPKVLGSIPRDGYTEHEIELQATPTRRFTARMTMPDGNGPFPAVVCIHGHGGTRASPYDAATVYRGFATELAKQGFVTIACDVGQHQVMETGRTLMGERFWDLRRCVDYLQTRGEVDQQRIGCGGLSLGGEMAMWLGALDERIAATVSCGFLTTMDQLEQGHCPCWKFDGLRQLVDWADVYALVAPRGLQCQNGLFEPPTDFCVPLARRAMAEIGRTYADRGAPLGCDLHVHAGGHVVDVPALVAFLQQQLPR